jgi:hypothetical protein
MMRKSLPFALAILFLVTGTAAAEPGKHGKRHRHSTQAVVPPAPSGVRSEPRMIEARPGVWVSTWEHIIDEGQGRWMVETREP